MSDVPSSPHQSSLKRPHSAQHAPDERSIRSRVDSEERPSNTQGLMASVADMTEEEKDALNSTILIFYEHRRDKSLELDYHSLLNHVIVVSGWEFSDQFTVDAIDRLINRVPSVKQKLAQALEMKKFTHLPQELVKEIPKLVRAQTFAVSNTYDEIEAAVRAWHKPYRTQLHKLLYNNIQNMPRTTTYSNSATILQSSGTGKSRMVDELAKTLFTIPFNLRGDDVHNKQGSWPPADPSIRKLLRSSGNTEHECVLFYYAFLGRVFRNVRKSLQDLIGSETSPEQPARNRSHEELADLWRAYLASGTNRHTLYEQICTKQPEFDVGQSQLANVTDAQAEEKKIAGDLAFHELRLLLALLPRPISPVDTPIRLVLYFDEADALQESVMGADRDKTLYDVLLHCLNYLVEPAIFVIFLSTKSDVAYFAPAKEMARSARARAHTSTLQAPVTETPFDCHPDLPIDPANLTLGEIRTIKFMSKFGRPLWWSMLEALIDQNMQQDAAGKAIIELARSKLIRSQNLEESVKKLGDGALAVLDVRLMLNFEPNREINDINFRLVASHMRTAYSIPNHRRYIRSGYPSEPILAEAAAQQMSMFRKNNSEGLSPVVSILVPLMEGGLLDLGERGEVVARLIITEAYDRAVEREHNSSKTNGATPVLYSRGCLATTFIEEVFPNPSEILDSYPDNVPSRTKLRDAFKKSILRFTHFARMRDDSVLTPNVLLSGFIRCMAFVGHSSQEIVDIFLPILIDEDGPLSVSNITVLMIQIKRRKTAGSLIAYAIDADQLKIFRDQTLRPYLAWIMELGVQPPPHSNTSIPTKVFSKKSAAKKAEETAPSNSSKSNSAKPPKSKKHVTINSGADIIPSSSSGTPANRASGEGNSDTSKNATTIAPMTPSKVIIPHHGERGSARHVKALHSRYTLKINGCSNTVYKGIDPEERDAYATLLASRDLLAEHARKDVESLNAVRTLKPFWSLGFPSFGWIKDSILNGEQVEMVESIVVEKFIEEASEDEADEVVL